MKYLFILLALFSNHAFSQVWSAKSEVPYELESLIKSIKWDALSPKKTLSMEANLGKIDFLIDQFNKEEFFFITKSITYKTLLKNLPEEDIPKGFFENESFLQSPRDEFVEELLPFGQWLLQSVLSDYKLLSESDQYQAFFNWKKTGARYKQSIAKMNKKMSLLTPWYLFFRSRSPLESNLDIQEIITLSIKNIIKQLSDYFIVQNGRAIKWPSSFEMKHFFKEKLIKKEEKDGVLNLVDQVLGNKSKNILPSPVDDWTSNKKDFATSRMRIRRLKKDPKYKAPKALPKPIDDWVIDF